MFVTLKDKSTIAVHDDAGVIRAVKTISPQYKVTGIQLIGDTIVVATTKGTLVYKKDSSPESYAFYLYRQY